MKLLIKALIPTFILFSVFARITALDNLHRDINGEGNAITIQSLMFYFSYVGPLLYAVLFLTQLLIIVPVWNKLLNKRKLVLSVLGACSLLSAAIGYIVWNPADSYYTLLISVATLFGVQAIYWALNLLMLYAIDSIKYFKPQPTI
ncbi:hypothetical protein EWM62_06040 [Mucilaginibacter terrigena]|uniref:Uncharacterized protein n=1 Tax=Mucilaginibacter terrigena TaxID=2492395 RepID=A0A4Q5LPY8_9SPHI|nr:hypothetical protein [Mucilaginibacter terrigena]RYU91498.1 hypothetical protein EWM62_06040 [Mucilaginibacter terrigena]